MTIIVVWLGALALLLGAMAALVDWTLKQVIR